MGRYTKKAKKKVKKHYNAIMLLLLIFIVFLHLIYISINNELSVEDNQYVLLELQIQTILTENMQLSDEILYKSSLEYIIVVAKKEGFVPQGSNSFIYIY